MGWRRIYNIALQQAIQIVLTEFTLIERYFAHATPAAGHVRLGVGDDCALIAPPAGSLLAVSTDMLVEGRHFFADMAPRALGHKTLAVNLSDLAAMGARPLGFTLALALPEADPDWLAPFSEGLAALANRYACPLIGGDTTRGPRNLCVTVFGEVPDQQALRRDAAVAGDDIWVSGALGDARLALGALRDEWALSDEALADSRRALEWPEPRIQLGMALRGIAHAALDISDGLLGDLRHILERSHVAACVNVDAVPHSPWLAAQSEAVRRTCALAGGDDYELCFTAPAAARAALDEIAQSLALPLTRIGAIVPLERPGSALTLHDNAGQPVSLAFQSFDHFR
ncbi:thiamine monophosphate kinase [Pandoraea thiooxydans]|nr:thiamine monophosphate kinase [Pandoraea thiooxydans]